MARGSRPMSVFVPTFFSLATLIVVLFVALGGIGGKLTEIYFLKMDAAGFQIPPHLQDSTLLQDISKVSGVDYVGKPSSASSLGIAPSHTISLLTTCGHFETGWISCDRPSFGYSYDTTRTFHLGETSLRGGYSDEYTAAMWTYARVNRFLVYAYLFTAILALLAPLAALCSAMSGGVLSLLGTIFLFSASIAATVVFRSLNHVINESFGANGLRSSVGNIPIILSFVAFVLSLLATALFFRRACAPSSGRRGRSRRRPVIARSVGGKDGQTLLGSDGAAAIAGTEGIGNTDPAAEKKPGLWGRIPTFTQHKYAAVGQPEMRATSAGGRPAEVLYASPDLRPERDGDWDGQDYATPQASPGIPGAAVTSSSGPTFPLAIGPNKQTKDLNTAYEPYTSMK